MLGEACGLSGCASMDRDCVELQLARSFSDKKVWGVEPVEIRDPPWGVIGISGLEILCLGLIGFSFSIGLYGVYIYS